MKRLLLPMIILSFGCVCTAEDRSHFTVEPTRDEFGVILLLKRVPVNAHLARWAIIEL
ncbi:MAG: hypothetical protein JSU96_12715 [Acidobacteriota bacterium]|nr:MAG: hypothetical protein JSU96_12715 [Acidobacteriota bacterium]